MASSEGLDESVDFDFFETPRSPVKDFNESDIKNLKTNDTKNPVSKPPVQPKGSTPVQAHSKNAVAKNENSDISDSSSESSSDHYSDTESKSSKNSVNGKDTFKKSLSSKSSASISSQSTVSSLSSDKDNKHRNEEKKINKNDDSGSSSGAESDDEKRPSNPTSKAKKQNLSEKEIESDHITDSSSEEEKEEVKYRTYSKISRPHCDDDGDYKRSRKTKKDVKMKKSQAWGEDTDLAKQSAGERPKTAKGRVTIPTDSKVQFKSGSASNSLSDSDITDVSPIESPRSNKDKSAVKSRRDGMGVRGAGDGNYGRQRYAPMTDIDLEDPDRLDDLDLSILMKAVGELEKQSRLKTNTRRVMFAPMSMSRNEKGNYTFDENQTREIERENNRLLKEIVRRVNSREHARECTRNNMPKLTPSAVNREREIRRIEMENLAILKRLKKVKPTKSISRENQLRQYESTMLHGVPIAALHPIPRVGRRTAYDDSASSMSSFTSGVSSVRSLSSRQSSRPGSAVRRPASAKRYTSDRPDWSDRW